MKNFARLLLLTLLLCQFSSAHAFSFFTKTIRGNGQIEKQTRPLPAFNAIRSETPARIEIIQGNYENITIESDDNIIPWIETKIEDGTLIIEHDRIDLISKTINITVRVKHLDSISLGGSGSIYANKFTAKKLNINIGGPGKIQLNNLETEETRANIGGSGRVMIQSLQTGDLAVAMGGSGYFNATGNCNSVSVSTGGSARVDTAALKAKTVSVSMAGSGVVRVAAQNKLKASIAGSGDVQYYGDPQTQISVMGSGSLKRAGDFPL